ncbi:retinol dehydrogenase 12-like isoform X1 [Clavelina lepadiformis]|uniref:retinol dehydrogenase 12-like isoform X1 n=1 Tax=Clavelina lepadiformis TaxID=159417 RepID=UPI004042FB5E
MMTNLSKGFEMSNISDMDSFSLLHHNSGTMNFGAEEAVMDSFSVILMNSSTIFWTGICLWAYIFLVVLAPKPYCKCQTRLDEKVVVITGGSDGVGKVTAIKLANLGAEIILPCRDLKKGEKVANEIFKKTGNKKVKILYLDFRNLRSVKRCSDEIKKITTKIDILVNNAGVGHGVGATKDGLPNIFGVNHLGPFLFTTQLLDLLRRSGSARVVFVSSVAHLWGNIDFGTLHELDGCSVRSQFQAYSRSKLANVLFAKELHRREKNNRITTYVAHPGWTFTALFRDFPFFLKLVAFPFFYLFLYLPEEGAQTQIHLAIARGLEKQSGGYFVSCRPSKSCPNAFDRKLATDLWSYSENVIAVALEKSLQTCTSI